MDYSEENLRDILELREWISEEIEKREKEIDKFRQNLRILDSLVKQSSFSKASSLVSNKQNIPQNQQTSSSIIPIKTPDNKILANAHVTSDELVIIPSEDTTLDIETHPFKSFFLGRIIGGMENQDKLDIQSGKIPQNTAISCLVNKDGTRIREILIKNYRQKERVNEIINTVTWSFSRMIENSQK
ncbi:MAG TPA: hypothetical protein VFV16_06445 [Candidatus Nitrosotalea sp.]|jgi:hypothetical protein|nr:hypothetical protein [Candidatus Nitrosotalea sp.]